MNSPLALFDLPALASVRSVVVPAATGACTAVAVILSHSGMPGAERIAASLMNFASHGTLRCICGTERGNGGVANRRQLCRSCGCAIVAQDEALLSKELSSREIKAMVRSLRRVVTRASHLELPATIGNVHELQRYLDGAEPKAIRFVNEAASVEPTQVH